MKRNCHILIILLVGVVVFSYPQDTKKNQDKETQKQVKEIFENNRHWFSGISKINRQARPTKRDKHLISINPDDKFRYKELLKDKNVGIVRLHDIARCDNVSAYVVNANCTWDIIGKAASFSFRTKKYSFGLYSDIQYRNGQIEAYGLNLLGFITELDNVSIEKLSVNSKGIISMYEFEPSTDIRAVKHHISVAKNGFRVGNNVYRTKVLVKLNKTYAIRSIAYKANWDKKLEKMVNRVLGKDRRADVITVFRVIRTHKDGSISILWKKLLEQNSPKLK